MLAIISNFSPSEFILILVVSVLIFGRRLPEVAAKVAVQLQRLRRGFTDFKREAGFDEEMRKARSIIEDPVRAAYREIDREDETPPMIRPQIAPHPQALGDDQDPEEVEDEDPGKDQPKADGSL